MIGVTQNLSTQTEVYTDGHRLDAIRSAAKKGDEESDEALRTAAKHFESVFMRMLLKSMREANKPISEGGIFDTQQMDFYQGMFDDQLALHMSLNQGLGLADLIYQQLSPQLDRHDTTEQSKTESVRPVQYTSGMTDLASMKAKNESVIPNHGGVFTAPATRSLSVAGLEIELPDIDAEHQLDLSSPVAFVKSIWPMAKQAAEKLQGLDPRFLVAQIALETGWGQSILKREDGTPTKNLFNIKADERWQGNSVMANTVEYKKGMAVRENAAFRDYTDFSDSFDDYVSFLTENKRYHGAIAKTQDTEAFGVALQKAGYATDPLYAKKIQRILDSDIMRDAMSDLETDNQDLEAKK